MSLNSFYCSMTDKENFNVAKELNSWIVLIFNYDNRASISIFPHSLETRDARVERPYRTDMETSTIYQQLIELFPNPRVVQKVLLDYPNERDMSRLVTYALNEPSHWSIMLLF